MTETLDTAQIAQLLGYCRRQVTERVIKRPDFPKPKINVSPRCRRWPREDVERWASQAGQQSRQT